MFLKGILLTWTKDDNDYHFIIFESIMKTLIIYDSVFGNTRKIAEAIASGINPKDLTLASIDKADHALLKEVGLLIIGSPTRQFRPTPNIINYLKGIADLSLKGIKVAAFDTRVDLEIIKSRTFRFVVNTGGYAANQMARKMVRAGGELLLPAEGFLVTGEQGPLKAGELERAAKWIIMEQPDKSQK